MKCSQDGCGAKPIALGLCDKHYRRYKKYGDASHTEKEQHGKRYSKVYRAWCHIKGRCLNEKDPSYKDYGGRGIKICESWIKSFSAFYADVGDPPTEKHQIDRENNEMGYEPGNCRWVLCYKNNQNRRSTKLTDSNVLEIRKSDKSLSEISEEYSISISQSLRVRNKKRWTKMDSDTDDLGMEPRP